MKKLSVLLFLLLGSLLLNGYFLFKQHQIPLLTETVSQVIDGDTFVLVSGERIRLLGVDAPELGRCLANEAKQELEQLVINKSITITEARFDNFNRRMGLIFVGNFLINTEMIRLGFAKPDYTRNSESQKFIDVYNEAKINARGINSDVCKKTVVDTPPDPNCTIKGNVDKATGQKFYHLPSCPHYNQIVLDLNTGEGYFCNEAEAQKAGFTKASECEK